MRQTPTVSLKALRLGRETASTSPAAGEGFGCPQSQLPQPRQEFLEFQTVPKTSWWWRDMRPSPACPVVTPRREAALAPSGHLPLSLEQAAMPAARMYHAPDAAVGTRNQHPSRWSLVRGNPMLSGTGFTLLRACSAFTRAELLGARKKNSFPTSQG